MLLGAKVLAVKLSSSLEMLLMLATCLTCGLASEAIWRSFLRHYLRASS